MTICTLHHQRAASVRWKNSLNHRAAHGDASPFSECLNWVIWPMVVQSSAPHWPNSVGLTHPLPLHCSCSLIYFLHLSPPCPFSHSVQSSHTYPITGTNRNPVMYMCTQIPHMHRASWTRKDCDAAAVAAAAAYQNYLQTESHRHHIQPFFICLIRLSSVPTLPHNWHSAAGRTVSSRESCLTARENLLSSSWYALHFSKTCHLIQTELHGEIWTL